MNLMQDLWIEKAKTAYKIQQQRKQLELEEKKLFDELRSMQNNESARGGGFVYSVSERAGTVDFQAVIKQHLPNVDLEDYRKPPTTTWKMSLELSE
jgi:hypothetical protein